jgi:prepilin-type processing-associated H-X9-DG protein
VPGPDPSIPVTAPEGINGPVGTDKSSPAAGTVYYPPYWKLNQIKKSSSRILFGDSWNTYLDPPVAGWDLAASATNAQSGDVGRHSRYRGVVRSTSDPRYRSLRANYCFVDGHVENLDADSALRAINDPR